MEQRDPLDSEAAQLAADLNKPAEPVEPAAPGPEAPAGEGAGPGAQGEQSAPGGEFVPNPAPQIAAALKMALENPMARRLVPAKVLAVFDAATVEQLAAAVGAVVVKHWATFAAWFASAAGRWSVEMTAAWVVLSLGWRIAEALEASEPVEQERPAAEPEPAAAPGPKVEKVKPIG